MPPWADIAEVCRLRADLASREVAVGQICGPPQSLLCPHVRLHTIVLVKPRPFVADHGRFHSDYAPGRIPVAASRFRFRTVRPGTNPAMRRCCQNRLDSKRGSRSARVRGVIGVVKTRKSRRCRRHWRDSGWSSAWWHSYRHREGRR